MKKKLLSLLIISGLFANSGGPGQGYAHNAPNMNNCTQCHSGSVNSGNGSVTFTNLPESYIPGQTYSIGVEVSGDHESCLLYTSPSPRDGLLSRMPSSA